MLRFVRSHALPVQAAARTIPLLLFALALVACGRQAPQPELGMTPVAGGMAAPTELTAGTLEAGATADGSLTDGALADGALVDGSGALVVMEADVLLPGQTVTLTLPAGAALRADAGRSAQTLQLYAVGEALQIVEPSGDYGAYPVLADGEAWYRVRAGDGLVGWIPAAALAGGE